MKHNDLDNAPTPRFWVMAEAVLVRHEYESTTVEGKWRRREVSRTVVDWIPNMRSLSELWRFSATQGARMELVFAGELRLDGPEIWSLIDEVSANPFSDFHVFEKIQQVVQDLPFRPDVVGVIDVPERSAAYGGRGMTLASLR